MPKILSVCDGPNPDKESTPGRDVTFSEVAGAFADYKPKYVSTDLPTINGNKPWSLYPEHVLIHVTDADGTNAMFQQTGFYLLEGLRAGDADAKLKDYRDKHHSM